MTSTCPITQSIMEKFLETGIVCIAESAKLIDWKTTKAYSIDATFAKGTLELKIPYRMGIGLFERSDIQEPYHSNNAQKIKNIWATKLRGDNYDIRVKKDLGKKQTTKYFKPAEIFSLICWEAMTAIDLTVEDYCSELFGNEDSHKGHLAHADGIRKYQILNAMVGVEKLEEFANLYSEL